MGGLRRCELSSSLECVSNHLISWTWNCCGVPFWDVEWHGKHLDSWLEFVVWCLVMVENARVL